MQSFKLHKTESRLVTADWFDNIGTKNELDFDSLMMFASTPVFEWRSKFKHLISSVNTTLICFPPTLWVWCIWFMQFRLSDCFSPRNAITQTAPNASMNKQTHWRYALVVTPPQYLVSTKWKWPLISIYFSTLWGGTYYNIISFHSNIRLWDCWPQNYIFFLQTFRFKIIRNDSFQHHLQNAPTLFCVATVIRILCLLKSR